MKINIFSPRLPDSIETDLATTGHLEAEVGGLRRLEVLVKGGWRNPSKYARSLLKLGSKILGFVGGGEGVKKPRSEVVLSWLRVIVTLVVTYE